MKRGIAVFLAALTIFGNLPFQVLAKETAASDSTKYVAEDAAEKAKENATGNAQVEEEAVTPWYESEETDKTDSENKAAEGEETQGQIATERETTDETRVKGLREQREELQPEEDLVEDTEVRAILVMDDPSLLEKGYKASELGNSPVVQMSQWCMEKKQDQVAAAAEDVDDNLQVDYYYTVALNGVAVTTTYGNLEDLEEIQGVKEVILSTVYETPKADDTNVINGAADAWESTGYTGKGSKVAIIDTGLDLTHPNFQSGAGFETTDTSLTKEGIKSKLGELNASARLDGVSADQLYRSEKVPFAFNYIDASLRIDHNDSNGSDHGTHVAGIAAANKIDSTDICGVAPDAQIVVMKVFGNAGGAYFTDIMAAMEDAMVLGCDSINISIGSAAGFTRDEAEIQNIFDKVCNTDIIVSVAAGNDYNAAYGNTTGTNANLTSNPDNGLVAAPGSYTNATTVASLSNASEYFTVGSKNITFSDSATTDATKFMKNFFGGQELEYVPVGNYGAKVSDFQEAGVQGKIALVERGGQVTFMSKQENAQAAGAIGVIVYNNMDGTTTMKINDGEGYIPCISISQSMGQYLVEQAQKGIHTLTIGEGKTADHLSMSSFSSWGCTSSLNLKPDIAAVGGNVLSTVNGGSYGTKSGTSMASPQIAGAAAVVKEYLLQNTQLSKKEVHERTNQMLMGAAIPYCEDNGVEFSPRKQGAGVLNVSAALNSDAYLSTTTDSAGRTKAELFDDAEKTGVYQFTFQVSNVTKDSLAYDLDTSVLTNGYRTEQDEDGQDYYLLSDSDTRLDAKTTYDSKALGYYYDATADGKVDTRDIYDLMTTETFSNREQKMADINQDDVLCDGADVRAFLDNLTGVANDVDLEKEALIVDGNETASVTVNIALSEDQKKTLDTYYPNGIYVEGYSYLKSLNGDEISLSLPYLGFYGDWGQASAFDAQDYHQTTEGRINSYGTYLWTEQSILGVNPYIESEYEAEKAAVSEVNKLDIFETSLLRNVKSLKYRVTEDQEDGEELYYYEDKYVTKALYNDNSGTYRIYRSPKLWGGTDLNGEDMLANNSKVTLTIEAELDYKDKVQKKEYPITVDTENPKLTASSAAVNEEGRTILTASFQDNQYIAAVIFKSANGATEYARYDLGQKKAGEEVKDVAFDVTDYGDDFMMIVADYAMNQTDYDMDLGLSGNGIKEPTPLDPEKIYGFNMGETSKLGIGYVSADKKDASDAKVVASLNGIQAAEYLDGYILAENALKELSVYTPRGSAWLQTKICDLPYSLHDMAYDYAGKQLYVLYVKDSKTYLSTMDIYTGAITEVGTFDKRMLTIGCTTEGQIYTISKDGELCKVDKAKATYDVVGKVSETQSEDWVTLSYLQSMAYDHNTGKMYWYVFSYNGTTKKMISRLDTVDLKTAETKEIGTFDEACEVSGLFIPYDGDLQITGTDQVGGISLNRQSIAMFPGQENRIFAAVTPWNLNDSEVIWSSDNELVATVQRGRIKGVGAGDTVIRATVKGTDISAECKVKVIGEPGDFYGYLLHDWHDNSTNKIIRFNPSNPTKYKTQAEILKFVYAGEYVDGSYYCYDSNGYLYKVDPGTWTYRKIGKTDGKVVEMTFDYADNRMYGILNTGHGTSLVTVDLNTGDTTEIGAQDSRIAAFASVPNVRGAEASADSILQGGTTLYGINENRELVTIDKTTGAAVKDLNSDKYEIPAISYVQSMTYDYNTGYLYWGQVNTAQTSSLYVIDLDEQTKYYAGVIGNIGAQVAGIYTIPREGKVPEIPYVELQDVALAAEDCVMVEGTSMQMKAKTVPDNATSQIFSWKSSAKDIVSVSEGGEVTANNEGSADITVTVTDEQTGKSVEKKIRVTVTKPIESLNGFLVQDIDSNAINAWLKLNVKEPGTYEVKNKSDLKILAGAYYNENLYAYSEGGNFYKIDEKSKAYEQLGTVKKAVKDMTFDYSSGILYAITEDENKLANTIAIVDPQSGALQAQYTDPEHVFTSLAADEKGTLYAIARDKVSVAGASALYVIDLKGQSVTKIGDTGQNSVLEQSMTYDFEHGYLYWAQIAKSNDSKLCIVDTKSGYASPIGKIGAAGCEVTALYYVPEQEPEAPYVAVQDILIGQGEATMLINGGEQQLTVSTDPVYATNQEFEYHSDDTKVVEVSKGGKLMAKGVGSTKVTVTLKDKEQTFTKTIQVTVVEKPKDLEAFVISDALFDSVKNSFVRFALDQSEDYYDNEMVAFDKKVTAGERYDGSIYAYTDDLKFIKIDQKTKKYEEIGTAKDKMSDLAFERSRGVMYGATYLNNRLVQVDLTSGALYDVAAFTDVQTGAKVGIDALACDEEGQLYGMKLTDGAFYQIDRKTAQATKIADTGIASKAGSETDLTYDEQTGMFYYTQYAAEGKNLYLLSKTGAKIKMYPVGEEGAQVSLLYVDSTFKSKVPETVPAESIILTNTTANISVGQSITLGATVLPISVAVEQKVNWSSSAPGIAGVDVSGKVTGVAAGTAVITATTTDGTVTAQCQVNVTEGGKSIYAYVTASTVNTSLKGKWITFSASDPSQVTAVAEGAEIVDAANADGTIYAYLKGGKQLVTVEFTANGAVYTNVGSAGTNVIRSMAYDPVRKKLYGVTTFKMFEIDMTTGKQTALYSGNYFNLGAGNMMNTICCDQKGNVYGILGGGALCTLDPTNGQGEFVIGKSTSADGSTPSTLANNSMCVDPETNEVYWAATTRTYDSATTTMLNTIHVETGKVGAQIGAIGGNTSKIKVTGVFFGQ